MKIESLSSDIKVPTLRDVQMQELEILKIFAKICQDNSLIYYLVGGTLLGAVRNKGFIPWDDDIDIAMPRKDYNRFAKLCKKRNILGDDYFYQDEKTDKYYFLSYAKIRKKNTIAYEPAFRHTKMEQRGIFIDIFPLDYCPKPSKVFRLFYQMISIINYKGRVNSGVEFKKKGGKFWLLGYKFLTVIPSDFLPVLRKILINSVKFVSRKQFFASYSGAYGYKKEIFPVDFFGTGRELEFEGEIFTGPQQPEKQLEQVYGENFMILPEKEKRKHHLLLEKTKI